MGAQGVVEIDFGAFPGNVSASVAITGQAAFDAVASAAEAWQYPFADTTEHTVEEQMNDPLNVFCSDPLTGTGFTIYAVAQPGSGPRYGKFKIGWCWN